MSKNRVTMWVDPAFRKLMKKKAADADKDMLSFTEELAKDFDFGLDKPKKKQKDEFRFF